MSPEEAAREWLREEIRRDAAFGTADTLRDHFDGGCFSDPKMGHECTIVRSLSALLLSRESAAREEERERCAKVALTTPTDWNTEYERRRCAEYGNKIAAAIRGGAK